MTTTFRRPSSEMVKSPQPATSGRVGTSSLARLVRTGALSLGALGCALALSACSPSGDTGQTTPQTTNTPTASTSASTPESTEETTGAAQSTDGATAASEQDEQAVRDAAQQTFDAYFISPDDTRKQELATAIDGYFKGELPEMDETGAVEPCTLTELGVDPMEIVDFLYDGVSFYDSEGAEVSFLSDTQATVSFPVQMHDKDRLYNELDEHVDAVIADLTAQGKTSQDALRAGLAQAIRDELVAVAQDDDYGWAYKGVSCLVTKNGDTWEAQPTEGPENSGSLERDWKYLFYAFDYTDDIYE